MEITFLGTQDATPAVENGSTSFVVTASPASILVEATGICRHDVLRAGLDPLDLDGVIISHFHPDHVYALPSLLQAFLLQGRTKPFVIHADQPTLEKITALCELYDLPLHPRTYTLSWNSSFPWVIKDLCFELFPVDHNIPTSGVKFRDHGASIVYSSDTRPCDAVLEHARGAGLLVHEATGITAREMALNGAGHSSARQAGSIAAASGVAHLFLCHCGPAAGGSEEDMIREAAHYFRGEVMVPPLFRAFKF